MAAGTHDSDEHDLTVPRLVDGPVTLRGLTSADTAEMISHCNEAEMRQWTTVPAPYTAAAAATFLAEVHEGWREATGFAFAIEVEGRWAGTVNLRLRGAGLAEIGFGLASWARHRSAMSRAVRLAAAWGFAERGLSTLQWRAAVGNWASRRVAWATGFRLEGTVTDLIEQRGRRLDGWVATLRAGAPTAPTKPWWEPVAIDGDTVRLRAHDPGDAARMAQACSDPLTRHWLTSLPADYDDAAALRHLEQLREQAATARALTWAIADPHGGHLIGEVTITAPDDAARHGEVGYWVHPDARGRGVATEAARLAVRHALLRAEDGGLGMHRVLLRAASGNLASQRVAERLGFTRAGLDRAANTAPDGTPRDDVRFDLLADELPAVR